MSTIEQKVASSEAHIEHMRETLDRVVLKIDENNNHQKDMLELMYKQNEKVLAIEIAQEVQQKKMGDVQLEVKELLKFKNKVYLWLVGAGGLSGAGAAHGIPVVLNFFKTIFP